MAAGQPTKYSLELGDLICEQIATTNKGMATICKMFEIGYITHINWLRTHEEYLNNYVRAKKEQAQLLAEEIIEISDDRSNDLLDGEYGKVGNSTAVQRDKLRSDNRKWIASKLLPKKYGDKIEVENTGEIKVITAKFGS
tara:strand:- start:331 stop:750 length:420 start_codon:yes stop_codon:yes gene_type:complete